MVPTAEECVTYMWPPFRGDFTEFRTTHRAQPGSGREQRWLDLIVSGMPRAAGPRIDAYLDVLEIALLDGFLAEHEKRALVAIARDQGLTRGQVMDVHSDYLRAMAEVAWADGVVTPKEQADLKLVARLLHLPAADVGTALEAAEVSAGDTELSAVEMFATAGLALCPGDRVCFTGEMKVERSLSGKASKAQAYGIPIVTEDGFERLPASC